MPRLGRFLTETEFMPFTVTEHTADGVDAYAVVHCTCDLDSVDDPLLGTTVQLFRDAYGEADILSAAQPDRAVQSRFNLEAIRRAVRSGLPNPDEEGNKPLSLANFRSEPAEIVARGALASAHNIEFPVSPQMGKTNPNMPILGFDGWGIVLDSARYHHVLVLVQVKGTDDATVPPAEAYKLAEECRRVPREPAKIARALSILALLLKGTDLGDIILTMLEELGGDQLPAMAVAPVVVRGTTLASLGDLEPIQAASRDYRPATALGVSVSVGADLADFGRAVTTRARAA